MMTVKQAKKFKKRLDEGEWPPLPKGFYSEVLRMQPIEIAKDIRHARIFDYGHGPLMHARRLRQMGLFDQHWNLTNYGDSYVHMIENEEKLQKRIRRMKPK